MKNSNSTITISYGQNSARVKLVVQDPMNVSYFSKGNGRNIRCR